jgi:hypothetical protein
VEKNGGKHARSAGSPMPSADLSLGSRDRALGITSHSRTAAAVLTGPLYRRTLLLMIEDRRGGVQMWSRSTTYSTRIHSKTRPDCATRGPNIPRAFLSSASQCIQLPRRSWRAMFTENSQMNGAACLQYLG